MSLQTLSKLLEICAFNNQPSRQVDNGPMDSQQPTQVGQLAKLTS